MDTHEKETRVIMAAITDKLISLNARLVGVMASNDDRDKPSHFALLGKDITPEYFLECANIHVDEIAKALKKPVVYQSEKPSEN